MPSILPILSYDVPIQDGAGSDLDKTSTLVFKGELHSNPSGGGGAGGSLLKKHPSACQELHDNKKKAHLETQSIVGDEGDKASNVVVEAHAIGDSVKLMKKAVFAVQTTLYNGLKSSAQLQAATRLLTQAEYSDVVTERSNGKQCGYPLCGNVLKLEKAARRGRYHISLSQHKVYDLEELRQFCSSGCAVASKSYGAGLRVNHEAVLELGKLEEIVAIVRGLSLESEAIPPGEESLVVHEKPGPGAQPELEYSGSPGDIEGYTPRTYVGNDGKPLKSALKNSPRKHQRITWADETEAAAAAAAEVPAAAEEPEEDSFSFVVDQRGFNEEDVEGGVKERLGIAQTIAEALSEAADASQVGEVEASEAAASAGLSIVPPGEEPVAKKGDLGGAPGAEDENEFSEADEGDLVEDSEGEVEEDLDENDSPESKELKTALGDWYDAPPEDFRAELAPFGLIWTALDGWVSSETLAYIYARESAIEEFRSVNGRSIAGVDGSSSCGEILRTISECVSRALPEVVQALGVSVPISVLEQAVGRLLRTMNFVHAVPAFSTKNWRVISLLFLDALSMRLVSLEAPLSKNRALLQKFVQDCGASDADYEAFMELLLPLGRLPSFSNTSGA